MSPGPSVFGSPGAPSASSHFSLAKKREFIEMIENALEGHLDEPKATATSGLPPPPEVINKAKAKKAKKGKLAKKNAQK